MPRLMSQISGWHDWLTGRNYAAFGCCKLPYLCIFFLLYTFFFHTVYLYLERSDEAMMGIAWAAAASALTAARVDVQINLYGVSEMCSCLYWLTDSVSFRGFSWVKAQVSKPHFFWLLLLLFLLAHFSLGCFCCSRRRIDSRHLDRSVFLFLLFLFLGKSCQANLVRVVILSSSCDPQFFLPE